MTFQNSGFLKTAAFSLAFVFIMASCSNNTNGKADNSQNDSTKVEQTTVDTTDAQANADLESLQNFVGDYPRDVHFLDKAPLKSRLQSLLGKDYDNFRKSWQTETPVKVNQSVLSTTGCEQHNCAANQWVLFIDMANDNINVFHFGENGINDYLENGKIKLPDGLAKEFKTINENYKTK